MAEEGHVVNYGTRFRISVEDVDGKEGIVFRVNSAEGLEAAWLISEDQVADLLRELLEAVSARAGAFPPGQFSSVGEERIRAKHPQAYRPWGKEVDEQLLRERAAGHGIAHLSRLLGRQESAIRSRLRQLGDPLGSQHPAVRPLSDADHVDDGTNS